MLLYKAVHSKAARFCKRDSKPWCFGTAHFTSGVYSINQNQKQCFLSKSLQTHHARCAPDVSWGPVSWSNQHLQRAILPRLNIVCEVLMLMMTNESYIRRNQPLKTHEDLMYQSTRIKVNDYRIFVFGWTISLTLWLSWFFFCYTCKENSRLTTQQAFPRSAIFTWILSAFSGSRGLSSRFPAAFLAAVKQKQEKDHFRVNNTHILGRLLWGSVCLLIYNAL